MSKNKSRHSVAVAKHPSGKILGYLSNRDVENGLDISLDLSGYTIESL